MTSPKFYKAVPRLVVRRSMLGDILSAKVLFDVIGQHDGLSIVTGLENAMAAVALCDGLNAGFNLEKQEQ